MQQRCVEGIKFCQLGDPLPREVGDENLLISMLAHYKLIMKISSKSVHNFLRHPVHKPINEQPDRIIFRFCQG